MVLDDPEHEFIATDYLRLEVIPKPGFRNYQDQVKFMKTSFESASVKLSTNPALTPQAIEIASKHDLYVMDALHASAAIQAEADEFVTLEKENKPFFRIDNLAVISLQG